MAPTGRVLITTGVLALALATTTTTPADAQTDEEAPPSVLVVQEAGGGSLVPVDGGDGEFELTLEDVGERAVWFTDQPVRKSGHLRHEAALDAIGFDAADDAPNSVLSIADGDEDGDAIALALGDADYDADEGTITYDAEVVPDIAGTGLDAYAADIDESVPEEFEDASLFVDDANGWPGCNVAIHFRIQNFPEQIIYERIQDRVPGGVAWVNLPYDGPYNPAASDTRATYYFIDKQPPAREFWCRMGIRWRSAEGPFFVYFNNPIVKKSDWGCTVPSGGGRPKLKCEFNGNPSGQPLDLDVVITNG
jgi:hypothetical protein